MTEHKIGTREEWLAARKELLEREKELTRRSDELARQRRELPWVRVEKEYDFDTNEGTKTLSELFAGRSQLLVYHFMHGPNCPEGCPGCDFNRDFGAFTEEERRNGTGFNFGSARRASLSLNDEELMALSAFALEDGVVYHTYSCYDRGTDVLIGTWQLLDRTAKGRFRTPNEEQGDSDWPRRHDEYEDAATGAAAS
jgi:predicted dithiol-disulfide oxidoreductase (DUF899 family)